MVTEFGLWASCLVIMCAKCLRSAQIVKFLKSKSMSRAWLCNNNVIFCWICFLHTCIESIEYQPTNVYNHPNHQIIKARHQIWMLSVMNIPSISLYCPIWFSCWSSMLTPGHHPGNGTTTGFSPRSCTLMQSGPDLARFLSGTKRLVVFIRCRTIRSVAVSSYRI